MQSIKKDLKRALIVSVIVGTLLLAINQYDAIMAGDFNRSLILKMLLTPLVPFFVSLISSLLAKANFASQNKTLEDKFERMKNKDLEVSFSDGASTNLSFIENSLDQHLEHIREEFKKSFGNAYYLNAVAGSLNRVIGEIQDVHKVSLMQCQEINHRVDGMTMRFDTLMQRSQEMDQQAGNAKNNEKESASRIQIMNQSTKEAVTISKNQLLQVEEVSSLVEEIKFIAFESKMLGFNASVEASRHGQEGKGFAVVADKIRNLAATSDQTASKVENLLGTIQKMIEEMSLKILEVENCAEEVGKLSEASGKIVSDQIAAVAALKKSVEESSDDVSHVRKQTTKILDSSECLRQHVEGILRDRAILFEIVNRSRQDIKAFKVGIDSKPKDVLHFMSAFLIPSIEMTFQKNIQIVLPKSVDSSIKPSDCYQKLAQLKDKVCNSIQDTDPISVLTDSKEIWPSDVIQLANDIHEYLKAPHEGGDKFELNPSEDYKPGHVFDVINQIDLAFSTIRKIA